MLIHAVLSGWFLARQGFNADETEYFGYVVRSFKGEPQRVKPTDDSKSPMLFPTLASVPFKWLGLYHDNAERKLALRLARIPMYGFFLIGAFFMFLFCYRLSPRWWMFPFGLYIFDPTVFTYATLVGTDMVCASFVVGAVYCLWRYTTGTERRHWLWLCIFTALALLTKASMIYLLALVLLYFTGWFISRRLKHERGVLYFFRQVAVLFIICWLVINAGYQFKRVWYPIKDMPADSVKFQQLKQTLKPIENFPLPLSYYYVSGFDRLSFSKELGGGPEAHYTFNGVNVLGNYYKRGPVWYYYLAVLPFKLPLLVLLLLLVSMGIVVYRKQWSYMKQYHLLWFTPLFFFVLLSLTNPFQIGVRHLLMAFPFFYLALLPALHLLLANNRKLLRISFTMHAISLISFWPNMLAYSSEWFWPKKHIYRYVNDTSVSYQHADDLPLRFIKNNPEYRLPPRKPAAGKYAILMEELAAPDNVFGYEWLYRNFSPQAHYMHNVALFTITEKDLQEKAAQLKPYW